MPDTVQRQLARYILDNFVFQSDTEDKWMVRPDGMGVDWLEVWARDIGVSAACVERILEGWDDREIWSYGVSVRSGWLEDISALEAIAAGGE